MDAVLGPKPPHLHIQTTVPFPDPEPLALHVQAFHLYAPLCC